MLSKFSVKKAYTVIVGIVLIIILGVVSLSKMSTDLLPSMNLPYAIVMTTYSGASPEQVERIVTQPIEGAMASTSNIKNISSTSSNNMSMVVLEFEQTANMDSYVTASANNGPDQRLLARRGGQSYHYEIESRYDADYDRGSGSGGYGRY